MSNVERSGTSVRGADGNLYFVPARSGEVRRVAEVAADLAAISVADVATAATRGPASACILLTEEGLLTDDIATASTRGPVSACLIITNEGEAASI